MQEKPFFETTKGILTIVGICCVGILLVGFIGGLLSPDKTTDTNTNTDDINQDDSKDTETVSQEKVYKDGTYKVGSDLPPGEYKFTTTSSFGGYIERATDSSMELGSIISNDVTSEEGESKYVTVNEGEYLKISGGELVKV